MTGQKLKYRKASFEAKLDELLPPWESFDVIAHELLNDGGDGWSVNDSWFMGRDVNRDDAIDILRERWEVFKVNYAIRARVSDIQDANWSGEEYSSLLEVNYIPFAEIRKSD